MKDVLVKVSFYKRVVLKSEDQFEKDKEEILNRVRKIGYDPVVEEEDYRDEELLTPEDVLTREYFDQFMFEEEETEKESANVQ